MAASVSLPFTIVLSFTIYMNSETFQLLPEVERFTRTVNDIYAALLRV